MFPVTAALKEHYRNALVAATHTLGGTPRPESFAIVEAAGTQEHNPRRIYHTLLHFKEISESPTTRLLEDMPPFSEEFSKRGMSDLYEVVCAVMVRVGAHHDVIYHVDEDYACADILRDEHLRILPPRAVDAPASDYAVTGVSLSGEKGMVLDMARSLFDVHPRDVLTQFNGKNEFLSAVYAGLQGVAEGMAPKYILAEMMMIEATRPFEDADRLERLKNQLQAANRLLPTASQLDAQEMEAFLLGAAQLANVDVIAFCQDFHAFLKGSVALLLEAGRPIQSAEDFFVQATNREAFFLNLLEKLHAGDAAIFHATRADAVPVRVFPPRGVLDICEKRARENIRKDILMCRALKVATVLSAAVEVMYGEGAIESIPERLHRHHHQMTAGYSAMRDPAMTETALAMRECAAQTPFLSLASYVLGHLGETDLLRFSEKVGQQAQAYQERFTAAFATRKSASELLEWLTEYKELRLLEPVVAQALGYGEAGRKETVR